MKLRLFSMAVSILAMFATACSPALVGTSSPVGTPLIPESGKISTEAMASVTPDMSVAQTSIPTERPTVTIIPTETPGSDESLGFNTVGELAPNLVDSRGRSLYIYMNDEPNTSLSACIDDCAVEWPPLTVSGAPEAAEGVDPDLIGTIDRPDGSAQATYNGWPLYYYNPDTIPGTTFGHRYNGLWFLIAPSGEPIRR